MGLPAAAPVVLPQANANKKQTNKQEKSGKYSLRWSMISRTFSNYRDYECDD
jgi:hypothetical protein